MAITVGVLFRDQNYTCTYTILFAIFISYWIIIIKYNYIVNIAINHIPFNFYYWHKTIVASEINFFSGMAKGCTRQNRQTLRAHDEHNWGRQTLASEKAFSLLYCVRCFLSRNCVDTSYGQECYRVARGHRVERQQNPGPSCPRSSVIEQTECEFDTQFWFRDI